MKEDIQYQISDIDQSVSQNLRNRRAKLGVSQGEMAVALGISVQQVQKYENSVGGMSNGKLSQIAHLLSTPLKKFF